MSCACSCSTSGPFRDPLFECLCCVNLQHHFAALQSRGITDCSHLSALPINELRQYGITVAAEQKRLSKLVRVLQSLTSSAPQVHRSVKKIADSSNTTRCASFLNEKSGGGGGSSMQILAGSCKCEVQPEGSQVSDMKIRRTTETMVSIGSVLPETVLNNSHLNAANQFASEKLALPTLSCNCQLEGQTQRQSRRDNRNNSCSEPTTPRNGQCAKSSSAERSPGTRDVIAQRRLQTGSGFGRFLTRDERVVSEKPTRLERMMHTDDYNYGVPSGRGGGNGATRSRSARRSHCIKVCVRKRPRTDREVTVDDVDVVRINNTRRAVEVDEMKLALDLTKFINQHMFIFDEVFDESCDNKQIYTRAVQPLVMNLFQRGSAVIFAFGQTGAGKTYTLLGTKRQPGLYWLAARDLFSMIRENSQCLTSYVSYYEIYCNRLYDLLNKRRRLQVREDEKHAVCVHGITEHEVNSVDSLVEIVRYGNRYRQRGSTTANAKSSRSHALLQIQVKTDSCHTVAKLIFVDLAGSERAADAGHLDRKTRNECAEINQSLLALKECIRSVDQSAVHTPYRQSKLTHILRDCFLGISPAVLIANVSPTRSACENTINTLWYAQRVKNMNREVAIRAMRRCGGWNVDGCSRTSTPRSYDSARSPADSSSFGTIRSFVPPVDSNTSFSDVNHRTNRYEQRSSNYTATCSDVLNDNVSLQRAIDFDDCSCFADDSEKFDVVTSTDCNTTTRGRQRTKNDDCSTYKRSLSSSLTRRKKEQLMRANRRPWLRDSETLQSESQCSFLTDNGDNTSLSPPLTQGLLTHIRSPRPMVDNLPRIDSHGGGVGWLKNQAVKVGERSTKTSSRQFDWHSTSNPACLDTRKRPKATGTPIKMNCRPESSSPQRKAWPVLWRSEMCPSSESSVNETRGNKFTRPADDNNDCQVLWSKEGQSPAVIVHPAAEPNYASTGSKFSHYHPAQPKSSNDCSSAETDLATRFNSVNNDVSPTSKKSTRRSAVLSQCEPRPPVDARQQVPKNQECASTDSFCCCSAVSNPPCEHSACCPPQMLPDQRSTAAAAVSNACRRRVPAEEESGENANHVKTSARDSVKNDTRTNSLTDSKLPSTAVGNVAAAAEERSIDFAARSTPRHSARDDRRSPQNERVSNAAEKQRRPRQTKRTPWITTDDSSLPVGVCEQAERQDLADMRRQRDANAVEDECSESDKVGGEFPNKVVSNLNDCSHEDAATAQTKPSIVITPEMFDDLSSRISDLVARRLEQASRQQSVMLIDHCQRSTRAPSAAQSVDVDKMTKRLEDFASQAGPGLTANAVSLQSVAETAAYEGRCSLRSIPAASRSVADAAVETVKQTTSKATSTCSLQQPTSCQPTSATCTSVDNAVDVSGVDNEPIANQLHSKQQQTDQQHQLTNSNENKVSARMSRGTCTEPIPTTSRSAINDEKSDATTTKTGNDDIGKSQLKQKPVCVESVNLVTTNSMHSGSSDFLQRICPSQIVHAVRGSNSLRDVTYDDLADQIGQLSDGRRTYSVGGIDCCLLSASPQHSSRNLSRDQRSTRHTDIKMTSFLSDLIADEMAQMKGSSSQINNMCSAGNVRKIATDHHFFDQEQKQDIRVSSECTAVSRVASKKSGRRSKSHEKTSSAAAAGDQLPTGTERSSCLQCIGHHGLMNNVDYCRHQALTPRTSFFSADDDREIVGLCNCSSSLEYILMSEHEEHLATIKKLCQQEINLLNTARIGKIDFEDYVDGVRVLLSKKSKNVQTFVQAVDKFH